MRTILIKLVRLVVVVWIITLFSFTLIKLTGGNNDLVSKIIPFGSQAQKDSLPRGRGPQGPVLRAVRPLARRIRHGDSATTTRRTRSRSSPAS